MALTGIAGQTMQYARSTEVINNNKPKKDKNHGTNRLDTRNIVMTGLFLVFVVMRSSCNSKGWPIRKEIDCPAYRDLPDWPSRDNLANNERPHEILFPGWTNECWPAS